MPGQAQPTARVTIAPEILEEAADWLMRCRARPTDAGLAAELAAWCAHDPVHAAAFARAERTWDMTGRIGPALPAAEILPFPRHRRPLAMAAALAVAASLTLAFLPGLSFRLQADHLTGTGGREIAHLTDGSTITLAADSAISVRLDGKTRAVALLRGEAYFDVAHDANRPFVVTAGSTEIEVLGTAFDVDLGKAATSIAVARGKVAVRGSHESVTLTAGEAVRVEDGAALTRSHQPEPQVAAWRRDLLVADDMPIADVVARLDRYYAGLILLPDAAFASQRVTGVFDLKDPAKALRALAETQGGRLLTVTPYVTALMGASS